MITYRTTVGRSVMNYLNDYYYHKKKINKQEKQEKLVEKEAWEWFESATVEDIYGI